MLHRRQIFLKYLIRRTPAKRSHGKAVIVPAVINLQLLRKVRKRVEGMSGIEALVILPVAPLYLAVMSWRIGADQFVADAMTFQMHLKRVGLSLREVKRFVNSVPLSVWTHSIGHGKAFTRCSRNMAEE